MIMHDSLATSGLLLPGNAFLALLVYYLLSVCGLFVHILARATRKVRLSVHVPDLLHRLRGTAILASLGRHLPWLTLEVLLRTSGRGFLYRPVVLVLIYSRGLACPTLGEAELDLAEEVLGLASGVVIAG